MNKLSTHRARTVLYHGAGGQMTGTTQRYQVDSLATALSADRVLRTIGRSSRSYAQLRMQ